MEWEKAESRASKAHAELQPEIADIVAKAGREASKGQLTLDKARKHVMEIYRLSSAEEFPSFSIEVWLKQWLKEHDKRVSPATMRRYTNSVNAILGAMGSTRNKDMALRATDDVANVRAKTARAGTKASFCELIKIAGKHGSQKLGRIVYFVSSPLKSPSLG